MFAVDDIDETLEKLRKRNAQLVGEVVQYKDAYRLCYMRGPEGLLMALAQELSDRTTKTSERPPLSATEWIVGKPGSDPPVRVVAIPLIGGERRNKRATDVIRQLAGWRKPTASPTLGH